jgi:hypothetical protein
MGVSVDASQATTGRSVIAGYSAAMFVTLFAFAVPMAMIAWLVILAWCCTEGLRLLRANRGDALVLAALAVGALLLRLLAPWGALEQGEPDRARVFWEMCYFPRIDYASVRAIASPLLAFGLEPSSAYRAVSLIVGTSTVVATYILARALGLALPAATLAGCIVLSWPPHIRYSGTAGLNVLGGTVWAGALAATIGTRMNPRWRTAVLAAFIVLLVYTREEFRLLVPLLGIVLLTREWTWRQRIELVVLVLAGCLPYLSRLNVQERPQWRPLPWFDTLFDSPSIAPNIWCYAGVLGLLIGRLQARHRVMMLLISLALFFLYSFFGGEYNPLFGIWRYYLAFLPMLAVGAAALVARLPSVRRVSPAWVLAGLCLVSVARYWRVIARPTDVQAQFAYLVSSTPRIAQTYKTLLIVGKATGELGSSTPEADSVAMPIGLGTRLVYPVVQECSKLPRWCPELTEDFRSPGRLYHSKGPRADVVALDLLDSPCADKIDLAHSAIFLGLYQPESELATLRAKYQIEPIEEQRVSVVSLVPNMNSQCAPFDMSKRRGTTVSDDYPDCPVKMGWYRLVPRTAKL